MCPPPRKEHQASSLLEPPPDLCSPPEKAAGLMVQFFILKPDCSRTWWVLYPTLFAGIVLEVMGDILPFPQQQR